MAVIPGFIGPTSSQRSANVDGERTVNLYLSNADSGQAKSSPWLCPTPTVYPYVLTGDGPIRALFQQDGRAFAVGGVNFYEVYNTQLVSSSFKLTLHLRFDETMATISSNGAAGHQLFITSGGHGYIFDTSVNTLVIIPDPLFDYYAIMGDFVDGYFVSFRRNTNIFTWSAIRDGTSWPALNFAQMEQSSDNLVSLKVVHGNIWLFGSKTTVVWANTGATPLFAPIPGSVMQQGSAAAHGVAVVDNAPIWLSSNEHGNAMVFRGQGVGSVPLRISTAAIEYQLSRAPRLYDAVAYPYQQEGHAFYVLYVPTLETTFVYDAATQQWHERAHFNKISMKWEPHVSQCHMFAFGRHLVGSRNSDAIYDYSLNRGANMFA